MKVRVGMSGKYRLKMFAYSALALVGCLLIGPQVSTEAGGTFLFVGVLLSITGMIGAIIGLQDHSL